MASTDIDPNSIELCEIPWRLKRRPFSADSEGDAAANHLAIAIRAPCHDVKDLTTQAPSGLLHVAEKPYRAGTRDKLRTEHKIFCDTLEQGLFDCRNSVTAGLATPRAVQPLLSRYTPYSTRQDTVLSWSVPQICH